MAIKYKIPLDRKFHALGGGIRREVGGRTHRFELVTKPMDEAEGWIYRHKTFWGEMPECLGLFLDENEKTKAKVEGEK